MPQYKQEPPPNEMFRQWCESKYQYCASIQTRASTKRKEKEEVEVDEKIHIGNKEMSNKEFKKLQKEDETIK